MFIGSSNKVLIIHTTSDERQIQVFSQCKWKDMKLESITDLLSAGSHLAWASY